MTMPAPEIRHPNGSGLVVVAGLVLLALVPFGTGLGWWWFGGEGWAVALTVIGGLLLGLFALSWLLAWLDGRRQMRRIREFLASDRPLVRWTYAPELWAEIRAARWAESREQGTLALGCLTVIFALAGALTGALIGLDDAVPAALVGGLIGAAAGGAGGAATGGTIALTGRIAARWELRQGPETVALGPHELYANGQYIRGDGHATRVTAVRIVYGEPDVLEVDLRVPWRPRMSEAPTWEIVLPQEFVRPMARIIEEGDMTRG